MNAQDFFELVRKMRVAQRGYFATRAQGYLAESKELETQVDREIKRVDDLLLAKQCPKLPFE